MATLSQHSIHHIHRTASGSGMPHGLGLLTTVASLPPKYRSRYLSVKTKCEIPLDLSVKQLSPQIANDVPIATSFTEVYTEPSPLSSHVQNEPLETTAAILQEMQAITETIDISTIAAVPTNSQHHPPTAIIVVAATKPSQSITPPLTPTKRKYLEHCGVETETSATAAVAQTLLHEEQHHIAAALDEARANPTKLSKTDVHPTTKREVTPSKQPIRSSDTAPPKTIKAQTPSAKPLKNKATRKLKFDEETSSPVSGTIIRPLEDVTDGNVQYNNGDIDPKYNIVEITEETKAELAAIRNVIGDYICKLCRIKFDDAFGLARHRCACIVLLEYRCPECGKQFNCPANLASHRRWHKPKKEGTGGAQQKKENRNTMNTTTATAKATVTTTTTKLKNVNKTLPEKSTEDLTYACVDCGKKFKRQAYLRKHQLTHAGVNNKNTKILPHPKVPSVAAATAAINDDGISSRMTTHVIGSTVSTFQSYANSTASTSSSSFYTNSNSNSHSHSHSSASSMHSYNGAHEDEAAFYTAAAAGGYDFDSDDECSSSSTGYGRLQIVESGLTEEENIAAAALTNLRNCASVIQHTTLAH